jgi:MOSC domain-containing protein YiiM
LQIGEVAVVELTMPRTGCEWLGLIHGHENAAAETEGMLGMLAMVIQSGTVKVGDTVQILQTIEQVSSES